jgi:hypothetical protein
VQQLSERQKTFARLVHEQIPPYRAYVLAGYRPHEGNPYRLSENERVKQYLSELEAQTRKRHEVTIDTVLTDLEEAYQMAKNARRPSAMIKATMSQAKLCGLLVEKQHEQKDASKEDQETLEKTLRETYAATPKEERTIFRRWVRSFGLDEETINRICHADEREEIPKVTKLKRA